MRRKILLLLIVSLLICLSAGAADFVGTMRLSSGYTLSDVRVTLDEQGNITLHRVKFARMMPVRVDVLIPEVKCQQVNGQTTLSGDSIVPMVGSKPHPDRLVTNLQGQADARTIIFRCTMGGRELEYEGTIASADCAVQQMNYQALTGIQGEPLIIAGSGSVEAQVPTTLSGSSRRVNVGKNRTRTAVQRTLIQNHQPSFIIFRGKERLESSPFAASAGSTYYVYALRRILC